MVILGVISLARVAYAQNVVARRSHSLVSALCVGIRLQPCFQEARYVGLLRGPGR